MQSAFSSYDQNQTNQTPNTPNIIQTQTKDFSIRKTPQHSQRFPNSRPVMQSTAISSKTTPTPATTSTIPHPTHLNLGVLTLALKPANASGLCRPLANPAKSTLSLLPCLNPFVAGTCNCCCGATAAANGLWLPGGEEASVGPVKVVTGIVTLRFDAGLGPVVAAGLVLVGRVEVVVGWDAL